MPPKSTELPSSNNNMSRREFLEFFAKGAGSLAMLTLAGCGNGIEGTRRRTQLESSLQVEFAKIDGVISPEVSIFSEGKYYVVNPDRGAKLNDPDISIFNTVPGDNFYKNEILNCANNEIPFTGPARGRVRYAIPGGGTVSVLMYTPEDVNPKFREEIDNDEVFKISRDGIDHRFVFAVVSSNQNINRDDPYGPAVQNFVLANKDQISELQKIVTGNE